MNRHYKSIMPRGPSRITRAVVLTLLLGASALTLAVPVGVRAGAILPPLGTAGSFGVLGGSAVTNTGPTTTRGDLGVSPGTAVSGFPPGIVSGTIHRGDAVAAQAQRDVTIAYNSAAGQACNFNLTGQDLGGKTLIPGVYCFSSSAQLTGQVIFDGQGDSGSVFIIQIGSTLTTGSNASVLTTDGTHSCNIFWQIGSSATLGTGTNFVGHILALTSITMNSGAKTLGGLYARNGAVTLGSNDIRSCNTASPPRDTPTEGGLATNTPVLAPTNTVPSSPPSSTAVVVSTNTVPSSPPSSTAAPLSSSTAVVVATKTANAVASRTPSTPGLPNTGGDLPWLSPLILLLSALMLAVGIGMLRLLRVPGES